MSESIGKRISELFGKVDDKLTQAKINSALEMLKKGNTEELAKKLNGIDKDELLKKVNELDDAKIKQLKIDKNEIFQNFSKEDLAKLSNMLGENGEEIVQKLKALISEK